MSNLKYSISTSSLPSQITRQTSPPSPAEKKMSLTQTYFLAHTARGKLSKEAARPAHNLRRLVGHANMLDNLMLDLANAEQEQESWFNHSVKTASKAEEPKHIQWAETIPEEVMEDDEDSDIDSDDDNFEVAHQLPIRRVQKTPPPVPKFDEDEDMEVDDEYDDSLALARTSSHPPETTPELMSEDSDSESDDESMPPSPPSRAIPFDAYTEKQRQSIGTTPLIQSAAPLSETDQDFFNHPLPAPIAAY